MNTTSSPTVKDDQPITSEYNKSKMKSTGTSNSSNLQQSNDDTSVSMDEETRDPNLVLIRQRNALYSKRKYYKKKHFIEQLKSSKNHLETSNKKLRESNERLESVLQRAKQEVDIKEQMAAVITAEEQKQRQLQDLLLLQQQYPFQAGRTSDTITDLQRIYRIGLQRYTEPSPSLAGASLQNLTTAGVQSALSRQILQSGGLSTHDIIRSPQLFPDIPNGFGRSPDTQSSMSSVLLRRDINSAAANDFINGSYRHNNRNVSTASIMQTLQSLRDQKTIRDTLMLQQLALENEQVRERVAMASVMAAAAGRVPVTAPQPSQSRNADQNALLQYYLSLNGRN